MLKLFSVHKCIFPMYHVVNDYYMPHVDQVYRITSEKEFRKDLDFLLARFSPVSMQDLLEKPEMLNKKNTFHLTFDDGLREMHEIVVPILLSKGVPATFFLNSAFVDNQELFFRYKQSYLLNELKNKKVSSGTLTRIKDILRLTEVTPTTVKNKLLGKKTNDEEIIRNLADTLEVDFQFFLNRRKPYLSSDQVVSMISNGFTFGGHSEDHLYYPELTVEEQIRQTENSVRYLQNDFNISYRLFAFPFTDHGVDKAFFNYFYGENQRLDFSFGTAGIKDDTFVRNIQRIPVEDFKSAQHAISQEVTEYLIKRMFNIHKIKRQ